jgi:hypothetical protein
VKGSNTTLLWFTLLSSRLNNCKRSSQAPFFLLPGLTRVCSQSKKLQIKTGIASTHLIAGDLKALQLSFLLGAQGGSRRYQLTNMLPIKVDLFWRVLHDAVKVLLFIHTYTTRMKAAGPSRSNANRLDYK